MTAKNNFHHLVKLMARLRAPNGCPWDRKQTHKTLRPFLLEEAHEVLEALASRQPKKLKDELGDLLFQVIFHAQLASEAGHFDIYDIIQGSLEKMTRRHPHVFGSERLRTSGQVLENWEEIKRRERKGSGKSLLAGVPRTLPALLRAHRVQAKAARVGFTWARIDEAVAKVNEEIIELESALLSQSQTKITEELGDAIFALVNLARFAGTNPEDALHQAIAKFIKRFSKVETEAKRTKKTLSDYTQNELLAIWEKAKKNTRPAKAVRLQRGKPLRRLQKPGAKSSPAQPKLNPCARRR
ncbi:nucleoside triphosphate pyrophosphohydrolase [bacterium]|nr:nucleoside triphosphate pyrophosphohydrolase [bacterium]